MAGVDRFEATLAACRLRLRPIIMTSFAFIFGVVPLVLSEGAGAEMRRTLGTAVFAGMLGVTLFGIFLTPVFFYVIQWVSDWRESRVKVPRTPPKPPETVPIPRSSRGRMGPSPSLRRIDISVTLTKPGRLRTTSSTCRRRFGSVRFGFAARPVRHYAGRASRC